MAERMGSRSVRPSASIWPSPQSLAALPPRTCTRSRTRSLAHTHTLSLAPASEAATENQHGGALGHIKLQTELVIYFLPELQHLLHSTANMTATTVPVIANVAQQIEIDVDTLDVALTQQLKSLGVQPNDMTSNQFIVADALALEPNQLILEQVIRESPDADWLTILDRVVSNLEAE